MHLTEPIRACLDECVREAGAGLKSLLLDEFTTGVVSSGYSRSELLLRDVYLYETIDTVHESPERLAHIKCIVLLRPSRPNVEALCRELARPHYRTYHVYFSARVGPGLVKRLAEADDTEAVRCLRELPLDYQAAAPFLFTLNYAAPTYDLASNGWRPEALRRVSEGLFSVLVALRLQPLIRFQTQSEPCRLLADQLASMLQSEALVNARWRAAAPADASSLLLIVDRRADLATAVMSSWRYYAMLHEHFHVLHNRVGLAGVAGRKARDPREMLVSVESDPFFQHHYHRTYGELAASLKDSVEALRAHTKSQHALHSLEDMRRFVDEYPDTRRYAAHLHNHVFVMSELARRVASHNLVGVSEAEQELACGAGARGPLRAKLAALVGAHETVRAEDALRLVCLHALTHNQDKAGRAALLGLLRGRPDVGPEQVQLVEQLRRLAASRPEAPAPQPGRRLDDTVQQVSRLLARPEPQPDNPLLQHRPRLARWLDEARRPGRLREAEFAFQAHRCAGAAPKRLIVFMVGGTTYAEALLADELNRAAQQAADGRLQVIVGSSWVHNFGSFCDQLRQLAA